METLLSRLDFLEMHGITPKAVAVEKQQLHGGVIIASALVLTPILPLLRRPARPTLVYQTVLLLLAACTIIWKNISSL